jgi:hypothetical protein
MHSDLIEGGNASLVGVGPIINSSFQSIYFLLALTLEQDAACRLHAHGALVGRSGTG